MNILNLISIIISSSFKRSWLNNLLLTLSLLLLNFKKCTVLHLILIPLLQSGLGSTLRNFIIVLHLIKLKLLFSFSRSLSILSLSLLSVVVALVQSATSVMVCSNVSILYVFGINLVLPLNVCEVVSVNVIIKDVSATLLIFIHIIVKIILWGWNWLGNSSFLHVVHVLRVWVRNYWVIMFYVIGSWTCILFIHLEFHFFKLMYHKNLYSFFTHQLLKLFLA